MLVRVDGRFAPSPTSDLHLGNLRTALLAWLFARSAGSRFLIRIEDLDHQRVAAAGEVTRRQLADLAALGLEWDQPVVTQSRRLELYRDAAAGLDSYECFCTRAEISAASSAPHGDLRPYPGTCARLSDAERATRRATRPAAIRVRADGAQFTVTDRHAGRVTGRVDDFVLFRNDGTPAYNLAVVVDDGLQGVQEVVRGADLLGSAPRQGWLARRLGFAVPGYAHVGMVLNSRGQRLAKRDGAVSLEQLAGLGIGPGQVFAILTGSLGLPPASGPAELLDAVRAGAARGTDPLAAGSIYRPWEVRLPVG